MYGDRKADRPPGYLEIGTRAFWYPDFSCLILDS